MLPFMPIDDEKLLTEMDALPADPAENPELDVLMLHATVFPPYTWSPVVDRRMFGVPLSELDGAWK